jgi:anti-sigma regulatory factor (Ser/Thr protein kinase)
MILQSRETRPATGCLRHEAFFYTSDDDYVAAVRSFVGAGVPAAEPTLVAVPGARGDLLRECLEPRPGLRFVDMAREGRNPGWIIPGLLYAFVSEFAGSPVRVVGEAIWPERTPAAYPRCVQHEALINIALADKPVRMLCAYDAERLDAEVLADAERTHPFLGRGVDRWASPGYHRPEAVVDAYNQPFTEPRPETPTYLFDLADLASMRALVATAAADAGLAPERISDLQLAVNEVVTNAITHAGTPAALRFWCEAEGMLVEVSGDSVLTNRLAGRIPAAPTDDRGRGLLLVNYLCDLVHVYTTDRSTTIRLQMNR